MAGYTPEEVCRLACAIIGAGADNIENIKEPTTSVERSFGRVFEHCRKSELMKRRWLFASRFVQLPLSRVETGFAKSYVYKVPGDALYLTRRTSPQSLIDEATWEQMGDELFDNSYSTKLPLVYVFDAEAGAMTPLFVDVLAARLADTLCEEITQSSQKKADAADKYAKAVRDAARQNAFVRGRDSDTGAPYSWEDERLQE